MTIEVEVPVRTYSLNKLLRMHWRTRAKHNKQVDFTTRFALLSYAPRKPPELPVMVTLTRVAPRRLDGHDNLQGSLKHVVDVMADYLKIDDADPRVEWVYKQGTGPKPRYYSVKIRIEGK